MTRALVHGGLWNLAAKVIPQMAADGDTICLGGSGGESRIVGRHRQRAP